MIEIAVIIAAFIAGHYFGELVFSWIGEKLSDAWTFVRGKLPF